MTLRMPLVGATLSLLALAALPACGGAATPADPAGPAALTRHSCTIMVARKSAEYRGSASASDQVSAEAAAWADVCGQLPEAERGDCKNKKKFAAAKTHGTASADAGGRFNTVIKLTAVVPTFEGESASDTSKEDACKTARARACEAAGEPGDCLAGGSFELKGEISSSRRAPGE